MCWPVMAVYGFTWYHARRPGFNTPQHMPVKNISTSKDIEQPYGEYVPKVFNYEWRAHLLESGFAFVWHKRHTYDTHDI